MTLLALMLVAVLSLFVKRVDLLLEQSVGLLLLAIVVDTVAWLWENGGDDH